MLKLIKKELYLCLHPTSVVFLFFAALVFVPNYPYEVIFFFSGLSVYFYCLTSRENGDLAFTCALPVKKQQIPLARILTAAALQCTLLLLTGEAGALKEVFFAAGMLINQAGLSANMALLGNGALLLGVFNAVFFPLYYKNPEKIGIPFVFSTAVVFLLIALMLIFRWTVPLFSVTLNGGNAENTAAKAVAMLTGLIMYAALTFFACAASVKNFQNVDV